MKMGTIGRASSFLLAGLVGATLLSNCMGDAPGPGGSSDSSGTPGTIVRLDPRIDRLISPDAALRKIADGFTWVEGPVWNRDENYLLFSDIPENSVFQWKQWAGVKLFLKPSGYTGHQPFEGREPGSNGLVF